MPAEHVLYLCTGSQGEPRAALSRIAQNDHRHVSFSKGDVVIFSSKMIPGNEKSIYFLQNQLADQGIEIVTEKSHDIHVSGHPYRDELIEVYEAVTPHIAVPVHGERRHLIEHAKLAKEIGVKHGIAPHNGEMIKLTEKGGAKIIDIVPFGRLHVDGAHIVSDQDNAMRERKKMAYAGHVSVSLVVDGAGKLISGPETRISGFPHGRDGALHVDLCEGISDLVEDVFDRLKRNDRRDEEKLEQKIQSKIRRYLKDKTTKRAIVEIHAHRV